MRNNLFEYTSSNLKNIMTGPEINLNIVLMYCSIKNELLLLSSVQPYKLLGIETHTTFLLKWREYVIAISAEDEAYY